MGTEADRPTRTSIHLMPFGAQPQAQAGTTFRIFAPSADAIRLKVCGDDAAYRMNRSEEGWNSVVVPNAGVGSRYQFILPDGSIVPDPASRYQPNDVYGPSEVVDPQAYIWNDQGWSGRPWSEAVLYELHIGTFTDEGTFQAALTKLPYLVDLGITAIELMCVSDFVGARNWGYDSVLIYAPESSYGRPEDLKSFVDGAHQCGIMVLFDVVYNHFGPKGNFIPKYFPQIRSNRHDTPWGKSLNFDDDCSDVVRSFVVHNALYWIEEFHADGLRLDASHAMVDDTTQHILDELRDRVDGLNVGRPVHLVLEHEQNIEYRLQRSAEGKALGYAAQWNHDISHLLGAAFVDLSDDESRNETTKLTKALAEGFVIAAQEDQKGDPCSVPPTAFVSFIQSHDLIGNRPFGERIFADATVESIRAIASIYLIMPQIPMLFMGEEWGASTPFPFFCDYHGSLADTVREGRRGQLEKLDPAPSAEELQRIPDPLTESTFRSAQLKWKEPSQEPHASWLAFYRRLLQIRRENVIPLLNGLRESCGMAVVIGPGAFTITWKLSKDTKLHLTANLCQQPARIPAPLPSRAIWQINANEGSRELGPWAVYWSVEKAAA